MLSGWKIYYTKNSKQRITYTIEGHAPFQRPLPKYKQRPHFVVVVVVIVLIRFYAKVDFCPLCYNSTTFRKPNQWDRPRSNEQTLRLAGPPET